jgi:hypothetical protein
LTWASTGVIVLFGAKIIPVESKINLGSSLKVGMGSEEQALDFKFLFILGDISRCIVYKGPHRMLSRIARYHHAVAFRVEFPSPRQFSSAGIFKT